VGVLQSNITPKARAVPGAYTFVCVRVRVCVCACVSAIYVLCVFVAVLVKALNTL